MTIMKKRRPVRRTRFALREHQQRAERAEREVEAMREQFRAIMAINAILTQELARVVLGDA